MDTFKMDISGKLIEGYVKVPPSFTELAIIKTAIQLCQNDEVKKYIILSTESEGVNDYTKWICIIEDRLTGMCEKLPIYPAMKKLLNIRSQSIALQLSSWNRQHQAMFNLPPSFADGLVTPSDWTMEGRLDEKKIAERLVQDQRIPLHQRYKMACWHCLEQSIHSLWNQMSSKCRKDVLRFICAEKSLIVRLWTYQLSGKVLKVIPSADQFWYLLFNWGIDEGSRSTVVYCWNELDISLRQQILIESAVTAVENIYNITDGHGFMYYKRPDSLTHCIDILCFLLTQMSREQRVVFFIKSLHTEYNVLLCFLQWPYLDLLLPIIKELWAFLPEAKYRDIILTLADNYSDPLRHNIRRKGYVDFIYGRLIIELLEETPDNFKCYVFSKTFLNSDGYMYSHGTGNLLHVVTRKTPFHFQNMYIFKHIFQHVTSENKRLFLRSEHGKSFCCNLAVKEYWQPLNWMLGECFPEDEIGMVKKQIWKSESGIKTFFSMLAEANEERLKTWLNCGFTAKQEVFQFIVEIFFRDNQFDFENVSGFRWSIKFDCLDYVIERYAPSEDAGKKFKTQFVQKYSTDLCISIIKQAKWHEIDEFLTWGFPSKAVRRQFKKCFVEKHAMHLCKHMLDLSLLQEAEKFLSWCFPSKKGVKQFRQELFLSSGVSLAFDLLQCNSHDNVDSLIKWFRLCPASILNFKNKLLFGSSCVDSIFKNLSILAEIMCCENDDFSDESLQNTANVLSWCLADEGTLTVFKKLSEMYLMRYSFPNMKVRQWVKLNWERLLNDRHSDLLT